MQIFAPVLTATKRFIVGSCSPGALIAGDAVRITAQSASGIYPVSKVDIDSNSAVPAVGVVVSVISSERVSVQIAGEVQNILTGMTFGDAVYVSTAGQVTQTMPSRPSSGYRYIQSIGQPIDDNVFLLNFQPTIKILPL